MCKILIHEPEAIISLDLKELLKQHELIISTSLKNLISLIRAQKFDLTIIDISKIDGWNHLVKFIRRFDIPVIILSTFHRKYYYENTIIELPFDSNEIINAVERNTIINDHPHCASY
jgi:DNA-binding response OmpR family regulator